jgi:ABC-2 type transport system ATP-binding protein
MIEAKNLTRRYGITTAVAIMRMLSGYLEPSGGTISIGGVDLASSAHIVQQQLGYLPENLPIYPDMMVADYLEYVATLKNISRDDRMGAVREAIQATDLAERALDPINTLSRGLKQRVGVAQAILGKPRLLILDEPTNGLDPVILSTHIMQEVEAVCTRVLVLRDGRLALDQGLRELRSSKTLLLRTNASVEDLSSYLRRMPQVASLEQLAAEQGMNLYSLSLHDNADPDTAANNITQCVVQAGAKLYQLESVGKDLDTVFREVNADEV